jgi:peptide/nickel transport system permease protein
MKFIIKKLSILIVTVFIASIFGFIFEHLIPGNPAVAILGPQATPHNVAVLTTKLGLNKSPVQQYFTWIKNFFTGHFGYAYSSGDSVKTLIAQSYTETLELIVGSQVLAFLIAIPISVRAAVKPNKIFDKFTSVISFGFYSFPAFVVAPILILIFAVKLGIVPASGYVGPSQSIGQNIKDMALPCITLALGSFAVYSQILRSELVNLLKEDFALFAKSKGISKYKIVFKHCFRLSSLSLVTISGLQISTLITGAFVIEYIFQLPGLGTLIINAINSKDYLVIQAVSVLVVMAVATINTLVDISYAFLDPRIRREN